MVIATRGNSSESMASTPLPDPDPGPSPIPTISINSNTPSTAITATTSTTNRANHTFPLFPLLPPELRLKIWAESFQPRAVEVHWRRAHYADEGGGEGNRLNRPKWLSRSRNPAALSVNCEARAAALFFYTTILPLAPIPLDCPHDWPANDRVLYINLEKDTIIVLGGLEYRRLTSLLEWFRNHDPKGGRGLRRLALSIASWTYGDMLRVFARTVFRDLEEFGLFMYPSPAPPLPWMKGKCILEEACEDTAPYRWFVTGLGRQFRHGDDWIVVGKHRMRILELSFSGDW